MATQASWPQQTHGHITAVLLQIADRKLTPC